MTRIGVALLLLLLPVIDCMAGERQQQPADGGLSPLPSETAVRRGSAGSSPSARVRVAIPAQVVDGSAKPVYVQSEAVKPESNAPAMESAIPEVAPSYPDMSEQAAQAIPAQPVHVAPETQPVEAPEKSPEEQVLARVDGVSITRRDVVEEMWRSRWSSTLDWLVGRALLRGELSRRGLVIEAADVDARLAGHLQRLRILYPNAGKADDLTQAAAGMSLDEYRERVVWAEMALRRLMAEELAASEAGLRAYFVERQAKFVESERVRITQIFISPEASDAGSCGPAEWAKAAKKAEEAHARLRNGMLWGDVARTYDANHGTEAGQEWLRRGESLRELEDAAFSLPPGAMSAPIKTVLGFHIITVQEKRERRLPQFEEVKNQVKADYEEQLFRTRCADYVASMRQRAEREGRIVIEPQDNDVKGIAIKP